MYHFDYTAVRPNLDDCIEVLMSDEAIEQANSTPYNVKVWCRNNTRTFIWMDEVDTTDVSLYYDYVYAFYFVDEEDANWFKLRWL